MKALTHYIRSRGLKAGIYTPPGPLTCAGHIGAYRYEEQDIERFVEWTPTFALIFYFGYITFSIYISPINRLRIGLKRP